MSINFSEFIRMLGSDPKNSDPEFRCARDSDPKFQAAAAESDRFEERLHRALLKIRAPKGLQDELKSMPGPVRQLWSWKPIALAASLVLAVAVGMLLNRPEPELPLMHRYLSAHFQVDGHDLLEMAARGELTEDINLMLAGFGLQISPELAARVQSVKICDTPNGRGVHFVFSSSDGPITVFVMPRTEVTDGEAISFDGMRAILVSLQRGSAAVIGTPQQPIAAYHDVLQNALTALTS